MKRESGEPLYSRLAETIKSRVGKGELKYGERMPTVREMCLQTGLSGGTVRQAYALLKRDGLLEVTQGRGTFVARPRGSEKSRKQRALETIDEALLKLGELGFSNAEARMFISLRLAERDADRSNRPIALVAESPEGMRAAFPQICCLKNVEPTAFVMDEIRLSAIEALGGFQLVIAHGSIYNELAALLGKRAGVITPYSCAPTDACLRKLYALPKIGLTALFAQSDVFLKQMREYSRSADADGFRAGTRDLPEALLKYSRLICAPDRSAFAGERDLTAIRDFEAGGGEVIELQIEIDSGSMLNINMRVAHMNVSNSSGRSF